MDTPEPPVRSSLLSQILDRTAENLESDPLFGHSHLARVRAMAETGILAKPEALSDLVKMEADDEAHRTGDH